MESSIKIKLIELIGGREKFTNEYEAVYFMVEIRKLLDVFDGTIEKSDNTYFEFVKFYCDWTVHTKKSRKTEVLERIPHEIKKGLKNGDDEEAFKYINLEKLRDSMRLVTEKIIPEISYFIESEDYWYSFIFYLHKVLEDQPVEYANIVDGVKKFHIKVSEAEDSSRCFYNKIKFFINDIQVGDEYCNCAKGSNCEMLLKIMEKRSK